MRFVKKCIKQVDLTYILLLSLTSLIIASIWFRDGNLFVGAEEGISFYNLEYEMKHAISTVWLENFLGMPYFSEISKWPLFSVLLFLNKLGVSSFFLQVLVFFMLVWGSFISVYFLLKQTLGDVYKLRFVSFIGSMFYLCNPYTISQVWMRGLYTQFFAYLYYPVFLLLFVLMLKTRKLVYLFLILIISFFFSPAMGNPTYFVSLWTLAGVYFVYHLFFESAGNRKRGVSFALSAGLFFGWMLINSWWLFTMFIFAPSAYLTSGSGFDNSLESLIAVGSQNPFINVIRLYHELHFETLAVYGDFYKQPFNILISFITPITLLFAIFYRNNKQIFFYGFLFIFGLIVCLGANPPFGNIFIFFFQKISLLQIFRNPYEKFGLVFLLSYTGLFALGFSALLKILGKKAKKSYLGLIIPIVIMGYFCWPIWTGSVINWGTQVNVPEYYKQVDNWIKEKNLSDERTFFTPYLSDLGSFYKWESGQYHGNDPMFQIFQDPVITQTGKNSYLMALKHYISSMDISNALSVLRVNYIVDRPDVVSTRRDKGHINFLKEQVFIPNIENSSPICDDILIDDTSNSFKCELKWGKTDLSLTYYIHVLVTSNKPFYLDLYLQDKSGVRSKWSGQNVVDYQYNLSMNEEKWITFYLSDPSENADLDYSNISLITLHATPLNINDMGNISIKQINSDQGLSRKTQLTKVNEFNKVDVYKLSEEVESEFGYSSKIDTAQDFKDFFQKLNNNENTTYILTTQNADKNFYFDNITVSDQSKKMKYSPTRYYLQSETSGKKMIFLNKSFNPEWKLIPDIQTGDLKGNFWVNINLLRKSFINEQSHYQSNGYANLWVVEEGNSFGIIYRPQVLLEIGKMISLWVFGATLLFLIVLVVKGLRRSSK